MSNINTTYLKVDRFGVEQSRFLQLLDEANAYQWRIFEWNEKLWNSNTSQCFQKVALNVASEASYVYILSGHKLTKNAKNGRTKIDGKFKNSWYILRNMKGVVQPCICVSGELMMLEPLELH